MFLFGKEDLAGKVAVITGAALGMGRELAILCAEEGCSLALCDVDDAELAKCKELATKASSIAGFTISTHHCDVANKDAVVAFKDEVLAAHGGAVHLLFNNAGVGSAGAFDRMDEKDFDWCMDINLHGLIRMTRAFLPTLKAQTKSWIVNTSSVAGFWPETRVGVPYTTSKFAVRGFTECLMAEAKQFYPQVKVSCVHPGIIITNVVNAARMDTAVEDERTKEESDGMKKLLTAFGMTFNAGVTLEDKTITQKKAANAIYNTFGYTAREASQMIMDGVQGGSSRIMVGWDAVIMDWWIRMFPRIFVSPVFFIVPLTAIVFRKAYAPLFVLILSICAWQCCTAVESEINV